MTQVGLKRLVESGERTIRSQEITPEDAHWLLSLNTKNRNLSRWTVRRFARSMAEGRWIDDVAVVSVGDDGALTNGQHTLTAVIESGATIRVTLQTGMPAESRSVFDTGNKRSLAGALQISGIENGVKKAAAANLARTYREVAGTKGGATLRALIARRQPWDNVEQVAWVSEREELCQSASNMGTQLYKATGYNMKPSALVAFYMLALMGKDKDQVEEFHAKLVYGEGLVRGEAALTLRNWMTNGERKKDVAQKQLASMAKMWRKHLDREETAVAHVRLEERIVQVR